MHEAFAAEFLALPPHARQKLAAHIALLRRFGPHMRRPYADTLNGSRHANMKELLFDAAGGVWRVAYAFPTCGPSSSWPATSPGRAAGASTAS